MDTMELGLLSRIDIRTHEMAGDMIRMGASVRTLEAAREDHEARLRLLEAAEAASRADLRRMALIFTLVVLGGFGASAALLRGVVSTDTVTSILQAAPPAPGVLP